VRQSATAVVYLGFQKGGHPFPPNPARGSGSAVSSPSGVWGGAPAEIEFGAFWH